MPLGESILEGAGSSGVQVVALGAGPHFRAFFQRTYSRTSGQVTKTARLQTTLANYETHVEPNLTSALVITPPADEGEAASTMYVNNVRPDGHGWVTIELRRTAN